MTILAFYPVDNDLGWDRCPSEILCLEQDMAFKKMWEEREGLDARFYDMSTRSYSDRFGQLGFLNAADFETDCNDEVLDISGSWCWVFTLGEDWVWEVVNYGR